MNNLENINNGMLTIDSRDVAKMMELPHYEVLKKLEGTSYPDGRTKQVGIIPTLTNLTKGNFPSVIILLEMFTQIAQGKAILVINAPKWVVRCWPTNLQVRKEFYLPPSM